MSTKSGSDLGSAGYPRLTAEPSDTGLGGYEPTVAVVEADL